MYTKFSVFPRSVHIKKFRCAFINNDSKNNLYAQDSTQVLCTYSEYISKRTTHCEELRKQQNARINLKRFTAQTGY